MIADFICKTCEVLIEEVLVRTKDHKEICPKCNKEMEKTFPKRTSFSWSNKSSLPPTASRHFSNHMRSKNFKKRIEAFEKTNTDVPKSADMRARYFGLEDNGVVGNRKYREPTMKDYSTVEEKVKAKKPKIITSGA